MDPVDIFKALDLYFDIHHAWWKISGIIFLAGAAIALVRGLYSTDGSKEWDDDLKNL